jgi:osmotically-inducible protein OsmY
MTQTLRRPDAELKAAVIDELGWMPSVDSTHVGVAVDDGAVTLSGEVSSYPEKLLAGRAAQRVRGVTAIAQEITVRTSWGANDSDIARMAGDALEQATDVPESVKASVHDQAVTLTGEVKWNFQRDAAQRAVRHTKGVVSVLNQVTIRPVAIAPDVKAAITAALLRNARVESTKIVVTTDSGGKVILKGTVRSWAERRQAEQACWGAPGVMNVENQLRIES